MRADKRSWWSCSPTPSCDRAYPLEQRDLRCSTSFTRVIALAPCAGAQPQACVSGQPGNVFPESVLEGTNRRVEGKSLLVRRLIALGTEAGVQVFNAAPIRIDGVEMVMRVRYVCVLEIAPAGLLEHPTKAFEADMEAGRKGKQVHDAPSALRLSSGSRISESCTECPCIAPQCRAAGRRCRVASSSR